MKDATHVLCVLLLLLILLLLLHLWLGKKLCLPGHLYACRLLVPAVCNMVAPFMPTGSSHASIMDPIDIDVDCNAHSVRCSDQKAVV